jgi:RNA polymerase sigma factor for flagellar operon FliA
MIAMHMTSATPASLSRSVAPLLQRSAFDVHSPDDADSGRPPYLSDKAVQWKDQADLAAIREQLISEHLPIVRSIARGIHMRLPAHVSRDDIYSAGVVGLLEAVDRFDPSKRVLFRTYAQCRIRGAILDSLRSVDWSPRRLRSKGRAIEQAIQKLTGQFQRPPEEQEIAAELNIGLACYQRLLARLKGLEIGTLYARHGEDSSEEELVYVRDRPEDDPLFRCLVAEMRELLGHAVDNLPERERMVVSLRYYDEATMKEISLVLGVTEGRVSQMHASAILHLRARLTDAASSRECVGLFRLRPSDRGQSGTMPE